MFQLFRDLKQSFRMMRGEPVLFSVAVLTLALAIGGASAVFGVVNAVMLKQLPYEDPDRLVLIWGTEKTRNEVRSRVRYADLLEWRRDARTFDDIAAYVQWRPAVSGGLDPERVGAVMVSEGYFRVLKAKPLLGRLFFDNEQVPGRHFSVILGHRFWIRKLGGDPGILGKPIILDGEAYTVVGVMPPDFQSLPANLLGAPAELYRPLAMTPDEHRYPFYGAIGRLKTGVPLTEAQADLDVVAARQEREQPENHAGWRVRIVLLHEDMVRNLRTALVILQSAVLVLVLLACTTVANMQLSRATIRQREFAVRLSVGASRYRLIRQVLTETTVLGLIGGALGLGLSLFGIRALELLAGTILPEVNAIRIDLPVLLFTTALSIATGIIFGLAPALQFTAPDLGVVLKQGGRSGTAGAHQTKLRGFLVAGQMSFAMLLLICAGLLLKGFVQLRSIYPGFSPKNVMTMEIALPLAKYPEYGPARTRFFQDVLSRAREIPGVESAGFVSVLPMSANFNRMGTPVRGVQYLPGQLPNFDEYIVSPDYFRVLSVPLIKGRLIQDGDDSTGPPVALINELAAKRLWPGGEPLGAELRTRFGWSKIVGIVADSYQYGLESERTMQLYIPMRRLSNTPMTLVARTSGDPVSYTNAMRDAVQRVDKEQPVYRVASMEQVLSNSMLRGRFATIIMCLIAGIAVTLATIGIYGITAYAVDQRRHEIGIRMALGAQRSDLMSSIFLRCMLPAAAGAAVGLIGAYFATPFMTTILKGVKERDPLMLVLSPLFLLLVAALATYLPARRVSAAIPVSLLRHE